MPIDDSGDGPAAVARARVARVLAIQAAAGEGPGCDARDHGRPALESELSASAGRWPVFTELALEAGARAVFAFPTNVGAIHVGILALYRANPGPLSDQCLGDALALAQATAHLLVGISPPFGGPDGLLGLVATRSEVHQATGMVAVQLDVGIGDALLRIQAHALAEGRLIGEVAAEVVAGRLRFDGAR